MILSVLILVVSAGKNEAYFTVVYTSAHVG